MIRIAKRVFLTFLVLLIFLFGAAWLALTTPLARDLRVNFAEDLLTSILEQQVVIDNDAYIALFPEPALVITQLRLPSENFATTDLAVLEEARLALPLAFLVGSGLILPEIEASGLSVTLVRDETGATTWVEDTQSDATETTTGQADLIGFLGKREIAFKDMAVRFHNKMTGFELQFELTEFDVSQIPENTGSTADVRYRGLVNGQPVEFDGVFPHNGAFEAMAQLGALQISLEGKRPQDQPEGDFVGHVEMQTDDLQNLLDTLRLKGDASGTGAARADLSRTSGQFDFENLDLELRLANGRIATLTGRMADMRFTPDFDLEFLLDLVGDNPPPPPAVFVKDIRPKSIELRLLADEGVIQVDRLSIETNAFDEEIRDIGPFRVERVSRAEDGRLQLKELTLTIGPVDAPYMVAEGNVDDLLKFREYSLTSKLNLPARAVLLTLDPEQASDFGRLIGSMEINEEKGKPQLTNLFLKSEDTALWEAEVTMTGDDFLDLGGLDLMARIDAPDGKEFLSALQVDPVDVGFVGLSVEAALARDMISMSSSITANDSVIDSEALLNIENGAPTLTGRIGSEALDVRDLQSAVIALQELSQIRSLYSEQVSKEADYQPLVLPEDAPTKSETDDLSDYQPLVLETAGNDVQGQPSDDLETAADIAIEDLLDWNNFVRLIDAAIKVDISRINGLNGISKITSNITLNNAVANAGPIDLSFGSGSTALFVESELVEAPDWLRIYGTTGGWNLGKALDAAGVGFGASGFLDGSFDLRGRRTSAQEFARSMTGKATIDMRNGRIDTALLDLAGLGVLPWLFSQDRRQGYAEIVCLKAPIVADRGTLSTSDTVLETTRVQLVGSGQIDLGAETINFRADPRPVGQPLSRSAWPFEVTGDLKSPDINIAKRTRRTAREPVSMPDQRIPCVPDVQQLKRE